MHAHVGVLAVNSFTCSYHGLFLLPGENFEVAICSLGGQRVCCHTDSRALPYKWAISRTSSVRVADLRVNIRLLMVPSVWPFCYGLLTFRHVRRFEGSPGPHRHILQSCKTSNQGVPSICLLLIATLSALIYGRHTREPPNPHQLDWSPVRYQSSVTTTPSGRLVKHRYAVSPSKRATYEDSRRDMIQQCFEKPEKELAVFGQ